MLRRLEHLGLRSLTAPEPPRRYEPWRRWPGVLRRELGDGYWIVEEGLLVCPAPVGRLELFAERHRRHPPGRPAHQRLGVVIAREVHRLLA